ncbi:hypothetical protein [Neoroseomonas soli]|uniref:Uncharacterized protein n=1 Tax=Neoroseomonas soli TaxID=1081025 RepID=A0A9X9WVJ4_9PROT|nr:hypothetical protein [Neoroseomonas soli]MBR0671173.1 hypothetical protein [Neoroseomonas soli]
MPHRRSISTAPVVVAFLLGLNACGSPAERHLPLEADEFHIPRPAQTITPSLRSIELYGARQYVLPASLGGAYRIVEHRQASGLDHVILRWRPTSLDSVFLRGDKPDTELREYQVWTFDCAKSSWTFNGFGPSLDRARMAAQANRGALRARDDARDLQVTRAICARIAAAPAAAPVEASSENARVSPTVPVSRGR